MKTPYQQWACGRMVPENLDPMELAWIAALQWAKEAIAKEHGTESTLIQNVNRILEDGKK